MITGFWWYSVYGMTGIDTAKETGIAISDFKNLDGVFAIRDLIT
jgi:hypothetical protein